MNSPYPNSSVATDELPAIGWRRILLRIVLTGVVLAIWFWTQSLIGAKAPPSTGIGDLLHTATAGWNVYFSSHPAAANLLLILSSAIIDALGLFLLARWLFGGSIRPFFGLLVLMALRQVMQAICSLPAPPNIIWHYPGFPSVLVTYGVANDFFFSGHTAIAVFGAIELFRLRKNWLSVLAVAIVLFEILTVLVLRAHYTMDVFTGLLAALWVANLSTRVSPRIDRFLARAYAKAG
jgi:PAP2 superfamily C-terminal